MLNIHPVLRGSECKRLFTTPILGQEVLMAATPVVPTPELQINTENKAEETIVHGSGRITSATSDLLQRTIRGLIPGTKRIVLDLAEVNYIDSSGLGALVSVYLAASRAQGVLELANLKPRIRDLFELSRLQAVFESHRK
jgi:anti-sigma B factor antagonist